MTLFSAVAVLTAALATPVSAQRVAALQPLVKLERDVDARSAPYIGASSVEAVNHRRPITGEQTVLPVIGRTVVGNQVWLDTLLPGRPNGHSGWILYDSRVRLTATGWHIVVSVASHRARVYRFGRLARTYKVIVGKPSSPTPVGRFFVEENVQEPSDVPGAPYALALSARSNVFTEFDGGPGQVALHGLANLGGHLGSAESHGCVRFSNKAISWLARRISRGTPVTIKR